MVIVCIRQMVALGSVSEQFTMAGLHLGGRGAGGYSSPHPCWMFAPLEILLYIL